MLAVGDGGFKPSIDTTLPKKLGFRSLKLAWIQSNVPPIITQSNSVYVVYVSMLIVNIID